MYICIYMYTYVYIYVYIYIYIYVREELFGRRLVIVAPLFPFGFRGLTSEGPFTTDDVVMFTRWTVYHRRSLD